jgi:hypothetical protein
MTTSSRKVFSPRLFCCLAITLIAFTIASVPASAQAGGCPNVKAIGNFLPSNDGLAASFTLSDPGSVGFNTLATYTFTSNDETPTDGVPGLIEYCVYPSQPPGNPDSAVASFDAWNAVFGSIQGFFAFKRPDGNPTNVPFDGTTQTMGTATWAAGAPTAQTILLHINDADECDQLYGGNPGTCFVFPGGGTPPPPVCNGNPACKTVVIDEAITTTPLTVPGNTLLHIHYTYVIENQPTNTFNMIFKFPWAKTDINNGGGKDYFGCEQLPDPAGYPGTWGTFTFTDFNGNVWNLKFAQSSGTCNQSRFFLRPDNQTITLAPGQSVTFNIDMITRKNKGGNQEYTSCGLHLLNSGFTVKWFQDNDTLLHSFSTNITPIFVNVVSGGNLVCP